MPRIARPRRALAAFVAGLTLLAAGAGVALVVPTAGADPPPGLTTTPAPPSGTPAPPTGATPTPPPPATTPAPPSTSSPAPSSTTPPPATTTPPPTMTGPPTQGTGLFENLEGTSPFCGSRAPGDIGDKGRESCRRTGAIANSYPSDNYGLDNNVDVGITSPGTWIASTLQWLMGVIWLALIYLVKGVLMGLEWAFTSDIYNQTKDESSAGVLSMYRVLGAPWLSFALACAGLWGLWNGLVRRRAIETVGALATTVAMMVAAQVVIHDPPNTVGRVASMANQASLGVLAAASDGTVSKPAESFSEATHQIFDSLVLRPWCALQFGDVTYCTESHNGTSVADVWLSFTPNSQPRQLVYKRTKEGGNPGPSFGDQLSSALAIGWDVLTGDPEGAAKTAVEMQTVQQSVARKAAGVIDKSPQHVELQEASGTLKRFALFLLVGAGVLGGSLLIGSIGLRMLIHGTLLLLVWLLLLPAAMLLPAFGEAGRRAFVMYCGKGAAAMISIVYFAAVLAVVVLLFGFFAGLEKTLGWFGCWAVECMFCWSLFLNRDAILAPNGMLTTGSGRGSGGNALMRMYYGMRVARSITGGAAAMTVRPVRAAIRPLRRNADAYRAGEEQTIRDHADQYAGERAREIHGHRHQQRYARANADLQTLGRMRARQGQIRQSVAGIDQRLNNGAMPASSRAALQARRAALLAENGRLETLAADGRFAEARSVAARGATPPPLDDRGVRSLAQQRRWEVDNHAWDHDTNLTAAGIDPAAHRAAAARAATGNPAAAATVAANQQRSTEHMRRDRAMLAAAEDRRAPMSRRERSARMRYVENANGPGRTRQQVDRHARDHRRAKRGDRRRARLYRP